MKRGAELRIGSKSGAKFWLEKGEEEQNRVVDIISGVIEGAGSEEGNEMGWQQKDKPSSRGREVDGGHSRLLSQWG